MADSDKSATYHGIDYMIWKIVYGDLLIGLRISAPCAK